MAFEGLTEKLSNAFKKLRGKGRLSEADVKESMREIRLALLEARRHYAWYLKGVPHAGYYKEQIVRMNTLEDVYRVTEGIRRDLT